MKEWLLILKGDAQSGDYILGELKTPEAVSQLCRKLWQRLGHNEKWTIHDLRRTLATLISDLGVAPHVVEQLLGHSLGGVMAIYNRSQYLPEKRAALDMWLEHINTISLAANNVASIRA